MRTDIQCVSWAVYGKNSQWSNMSSRLWRWTDMFMKCSCWSCLAIWHCNRIHNRCILGLSLWIVPTISNIESIDRQRRVCCYKDRPSHSRKCQAGFTSLLKHYELSGRHSAISSNMWRVTGACCCPVTLMFIPMSKEKQDHSGQFHHCWLWYAT